MHSTNWAEVLLDSGTCGDSDADLAVFNHGANDGSWRSCEPAEWDLSPRSAAPDQRLRTAALLTVERIV